LLAVAVRSSDRLNHAAGRMRYFYTVLFLSDDTLSASSAPWLLRMAVPLSRSFFTPCLLLLPRIRPRR
jgi:hypothetical protein